MEDNNQNQAPQNIPAQTPTTPASEPPPSNNARKGKRKILIGASLLAIAFIVLIVYAVLSEILGLSRQVRNIPTLPTATPTPDSSNISTWKTYTNSKHGYAIKYPEGFGVDEMEGVTIIFKGEKIKIPPNSPIEPYPTSLAIYNRTNATFNNADEACEAELCQNLNNPAVGQNYKKEQVQINNAFGVKVTSADRKYSLDYYLANSSGSQIVRIPLGANIAASSRVSNESQQLEAFNSLQQILSTFKFMK